MVSPAGTPPSRSFLRRAGAASRRAAGAVIRRHRQGPYRGYVDGVGPEGLLRGWVIDRRTGQGRVAVALMIGDELVETGYANALREDVRTTTGGEVECGFYFQITDAIRDKAQRAGGRLSVWTHGAGR